MTTKEECEERGMEFIPSHNERKFGKVHHVRAYCRKKSYWQRKIDRVIEKQNYAIQSAIKKIDWKSLEQEMDKKLGDD